MFQVALFFGWRGLVKNFWASRGCSRSVKRELTCIVTLINEEAKVGFFRAETNAVLLLELRQRNRRGVNCVKFAIIFLEPPYLANRKGIKIRRVKSRTCSPLSAA